MWVYRSIVCAQTLSASVLETLAKENIPNKWICENKYFVGQGVDASKRLSELSQSLVLSLLANDKHTTKAINAEVVQSEYCLPAKAAENWLARKKQQFGQFAQKSKAWQRVEEHLFSQRGRLGILACLKAGVPLEGTSEEQPGIECCRILVADMQKLLGGPSKPQAADEQTSAGS